ncbi:MAG: glycosyltransferase family 4 protein [Vicinamibacterales bacterium]
MRIAVDARELQGRPTGVGRFLSELLCAWKGLPDAQPHEFLLLAPDDGGGTAWEQFTLPRLIRESGADMLFAPAYTAPLRAGVPVVLVIHDVSFCAHPEWFSWREGARRRTITTLAARRARRVITVSEFSKREVVAHLGVDASKVDVVYHGLTRVASGSTTDVASGFSRKSGTTVLYVGSLFNRRHVPELIDGFARFNRTGQFDLQIVGENRTSPHIPFTALPPRVHLRSYVPDEELMRLYGQAAAFVFLSDYEGFGLTPLEAMGAGVPSIVLDTPVSREVYGDAAFYVPRPDPDLIAAALAEVTGDTATRQRLLAAAPSALARYSWDASARRVLEILTR